MAAQIVMDHSTDRVHLAEHLPLDTPMSVFMLASSVCNFKCYYCVHSAEKPSATGDFAFQRMRALKREHPFLALDTVKQFVAQAQKFPQKMKAVILASLGEPLLNPQIAEIVKCIKDAEIAERVDIVTNASCLTPALSDRLIEAGLDKLRISIQGLDREAYYRSSGVHVDFEQIITNIAYFYRNKRNTTVYVKIMEEQLRDQAQKIQFLTLFGGATPHGGGGVNSGICDQLSIEHLVPLIPALSDRPREDYPLTINGSDVAMDYNVCFRPFMNLQLMTNGDVSSCCAPDYHIYGNIFHTPVTTLWTGEPRAALLRQMLAQGKQSISACAGCTFPQFETRAEDNLDPYAAALLPLF